MVRNDDFHSTCGRCGAGRAYLEMGMTRLSLFVAGTAAVALATTAAAKTPPAKPAHERPAAAAPDTAPAAPDGRATEPLLTVQQAVALASSDQPSVAAYESEAIAAEQAAAAARTLPDPVVSAGIQNYPVTGRNAPSPTRDEMTMYTIGVMGEQVRRSQREAEAARLRSEAAVSRFQGSARQRTIQRDVMKAWIAAVEARAKQGLLIRVIGDLRTGQKIMEAGVPTGASTPALALEAQAEVSLAESELADAKGAEERARGMLRRWIAAAADRPLPDYIPRIDLPHGVAPDFNAHPEVLVANAEEAAALGQAEVARTQRRPNVSWSATVGFRPAYGEMASLQVSIPLQLNRRNLQDRRIAEAQARANAALLRAEDTKRDLGGQYSQALADYRSADARVQEIGGHAIPSLEASFKAAEARYSGGQGTLELPLNIVRRYVETNIQLVVQQAAKARAAADLIYLTGEPGR
ncbi:MAG: TolC family protein [Pseudomonadota bacterium]